MAYKNIDINELGMKQKIQYKASRVAFFVPRLLTKLAKKVVLNPVTKIVTGNSYEEIKSAATQGVMAYQNELADDMQEEIDNRKEAQEAWSNDSDYMIGNLGKFKAHQSYVNDLEKKQKKLRQSPKKLLVARTYVDVMKSRSKERKEEKKVAKMVKAVIEEYTARQEIIKAKQLEIDALKDALARAQKEVGDMQGELNNFAVENAEIINQMGDDAEPTVEQTSVQTEAPAQDDNMINLMSSFAQNGGQPIDPAAMAQYGLNTQTGEAVSAEPEKTM